MGVLIDTSVLIAIERGEAELPSVAADEPVAIAAITASELLHGVHRAKEAQRRARRERFVEAVFAGTRVLPFDLDTARVHSRIWADLVMAGTPIGPHDLIIAAPALAHQLPLLTLNLDEFRRVEGLQLSPL